MPKILIFWTILSLASLGLSCASSMPASKASEGGSDAETSDDAASSDNDAATTSTVPIDVHVHALISAESATLAELSSALSDESIGGNVLMSAPVAFLSEDPEADDSAALVAFAGSVSGTYRVLYGGSELQPLLHAVGRSETFTEDLVYPNGGAPANIDESLAEMSAVAADPTTWEDTFLDRARAAAESGSYAGFGEIAPLHLSLREGHPSIEFAADHPWMLSLSELSSSFDLPIDLHLEATESSISQLENLLAHDRGTKIIWDHAGWTNTGFATAERISTLMAAHENLYLSLKLRESESEEMEAGSPLEADGTLKTDWSELIETYADRIMLGTDVKYWQEQGDQVATPADILISTWESVDGLLDQLSAETSRKVSHDTAAELFGY